MWPPGSPSEYFEKLRAGRWMGAYHCPIKPHHLVPGEWASNPIVCFGSSSYWVMSQNRNKMCCLTDIGHLLLPSYIKTWDTWHEGSPFIISSFTCPMLEPCSYINLGADTWKLSFSSFPLQLPQRKQLGFVRKSVLLDLQAVAWSLGYHLSF